MREKVKKIKFRFIEKFILKVFLSHFIKEQNNLKRKRTFYCGFLQRCMRSKITESVEDIPFALTAPMFFIVCSAVEAMIPLSFGMMIP